MAEENSYIGNFILEDGVYYIHKHAKNIGNASGGSVSAIADSYNSQRAQAVQASKTYYKTLLKSSLSSNSVALLNEAFSNDDIMTELNNQMTQAIQKSVNINAIRKGMQLQRAMISKEIDKGLKKGSVKALDDLLNALSKTCLLLKSKEGSTLATILLQARESGGSVAAISGNLKVALQNFIANNNGKTFSGQQANLVAQTINSLASALSSGKTSSGNKLTRDAIQKMMDAIFNTGLGESFGGMIKTTAEVNVRNSIKSLTGADKTRIQVTDEKGNITGFQGDSSSGKADAKFQNVLIKIDSKNGLNGGDILIDIGISNKQYRTQFFPGLTNKVGTLNIGGGSGGTVREALDSVYGAGASYSKYLAYNYLGHGNNAGVKLFTEKIKDLILTRQMMRIFSSRGGSVDFAQFILANGVVVPIWSLIMASENLDNQMVTLSFSDSLSGGIDIEDMYRRSSMVNHSINTATITAHVHIHKLLDLKSF